ncbi:MAG: hypothetical protein JSR77_13320 [Planctomycetes bacterium]|nr:hypothetical protein [Planctomycetota bacterium]
MIRNEQREGDGELGRWDEIVTIRPHGSSESLRLLIESNVRLHPQRAIAVVDRLRREPLPPVPTSLAVVAAPYISERVAQVCREGGIGYVDAAGNCRISAPGFHLQVEGRKNELPDTRPAENLFAAKSSRIVRALIEQPERVWRVQDLAREVGVSMGLASRIKHKLIEQAFAEEIAPGIRARNPGALLDAWAAVYKGRSRAILVYSMDEIAALERRIAGWCADHAVKFALAEFSAAARLSPMVRHKRAAVYIQEALSRDVAGLMMRELELKEVDTGATAVLWVTEDDSVFYNCSKQDGLTIVSAVQAYLDLMRNPGRGREAAEQVLRWRGTSGLEAGRNNVS